MSGTLLDMLGRGARVSRKVGVERLAHILRSALDVLLVTVRWPPLAAEVDGIPLRGFLRHRSFLAAVASGHYEPFTREMFVRALRSAMLVVDGGAHIGLYTLLAARWLGVRGKVIAFEPDPYNFLALTLNVPRGASGAAVDARPAALADRRGERGFFSSPGTISGSVVDRPAVGPRRTLRVAVTTLDEELCDLPCETLLVKLDLEGGELWALRGMRQTLRRARSVVLIVEVNPDALRDAGTSSLELLAEIERQDLRARFIDDTARTLVPVTRTSHIQKGNLYCTKSDACSDPGAVG